MPVMSAYSDSESVEVEFHLISHNFLIKMDNSSFPKILDFKNKLLIDKQLLSLKAWFAKYDFIVQHIKGDKNLILDFLTRPSINKPTRITFIQTIPIIAMNRSLPIKALTQKTFPLNLSFSSAFQIQDFARKFLFHYFMNVYRTQPGFLSLHLEHLFLTGFTLSPTLTISEDELWYVWCLIVLYATKLVLLGQPTLRHITTPDTGLWDTKNTIIHLLIWSGLDWEWILYEINVPGEGWVL